MSAFNMNDGSALTGTHTFTNGSAVVNGNASAVYKSEVSIGEALKKNLDILYLVLTN